MSSGERHRLCNVLWQRLIRWAGGGGRGPTAEDEATRRVLIMAAVVTLTVTVVWLPIFLRYGFQAAGWVMAGNAVCMVAALVWLHYGRRWHGPLYLLLASNLLVGVALHWVLGGFSPSRGILFWALLGPVFAAFILSFRAALTWLVITLGTITLEVVAAPELGPHPPMPQWVLTSMNINNLITPGATAALAVMYAVQRARRERERTEHLLLNILPSDVVVTLKGGAATIADHYGATSVLFADIVDFTPCRLASALCSWWNC